MHQKHLSLHHQDSVEDILKVEEQKRENVLNEMLDEDIDLKNFTV
jgi:hypothetical protein